MDFQKIAEYFEKIEKVSSRLEMTDLLAELLKEPSAEETRKLIYLSQGKLGPDFENIEAGLGEKLVIEAISKASGYGKKEIEKEFRDKGDLGLVAMEFASKKRQKSLFSEQLSLNKVFKNFLKIAKAEGHGSQELKIRLLVELLNSATALEAKFITRIPLGNLRLGIGDPTIMDALALIFLKEFKKKNKKLVEELQKEIKTKKEFERKEELQRKLRMKLREKIEEKYNIHSDLGRIGEILKKHGLKGLNKIKIVPGIPIRPTLAERLSSAEEILEKIGKCAVEGKYDGFRFQVHFDDKSVKIFSRRQEDMTHMFPEIVDAVKKQIKAKSAIFEGEALAFNEQTQEYFPFQVTIQRKRKYGIKKMSEQLPLKLFVFDLMMLNDNDLMNLPFKERRKKLEEIVKKGPVIELTESIVTDSAKKINEFFNACVEKGLEGVIAKDLNARYIAGARKFAWIKLKRSYKGELTDSIDVVVIGYYKGKGQRTQFGLGTLLTAVYNNEKDEFESIAKIGTGITEEKFVELEKIFSKIKVKKKPTRVNSGLEPDYWVEPKYVVEVIADEITKSPTHACAKDRLGEGLALRFPRMVSLRRDRKPEQATTTEEVIKLFKQQKHVSLDSEEPMQEKKGN